MSVENKPDSYMHSVVLFLTQTSSSFRSEGGQATSPWHGCQCWGANWTSHLDFSVTNSPKNGTYLRPIQNIRYFNYSPTTQPLKLKHQILLAENLFLQPPENHIIVSQFDSNFNGYSIF